MNRLVIDSWAWIEFLKGNAKGAAVKNAIAGADLATVSTNLYEVLYRTSEDEGEPAAEKARLFIESHSQIIPVDGNLAYAAVRVRREEKLHALDAFAYAAARQWGAKLLTGDPHFRGKRDIQFIE
ncbi:PIN domain-containing protein [Candidatus Micrarchaeota archaeon]|nr:PIN domain-containing protein [Candidatus Micrarchaeota archaeon]MBI5176987.1 PIN domain-containing protein [Candidatus Micrarchaeota archaeon]